MSQKTKKDYLPVTGFITQEEKEMILKAMDEYADHEAIAFAEWILKEEYKMSMSKPGHFVHSFDLKVVFYTPAELYDIFKQKTQP
jgi:hypothetical protein